jgi:hypothetical protein
MTTMKFEFDFVMNENHGDTGWKLRRPNSRFEAFRSNLAHDILEHFPNGDAGVEDELMAFGAIIGGRGDAGEFSQMGAYRSPGKVIADELIYMYHKDAGGELVKEPKGFRMGGWVEKEIREAIIEAYKPIDSSNDSYADEMETLANTVWDSSEQKRHIMGWIWRGYLRWKRRFKNADAFDFTSAYKRMNEAIDRAGEHAEEGMELIVHVIGCELRSVKCRERLGYW